MSSTRQYATTSQVSTLLGSDYTVNKELINQAEAIIDSVVYTELSNPLARYFVGEGVFTKTFTAGASTSTVTLDSNTHDDEYYKFCVIELLDTGDVYPVTSSTNSELTIDGVVSGSKDFKIYQLGKFPRVMDVRTANNKVYKSIPQEVRQAVAWQVKYIIDEGQKAGDVFSASGVQSESIGEDYRYSLGDGDSVGASAMSQVRLLAPQARTLLRRFMKR